MEFINGYKTYLGVVVWGVVNVLMGVAPEYMEWWKLAETLAMTLTGVGVGHKLAKMS